MYSMYTLHVDMYLLGEMQQMLIQKGNSYLRRIIDICMLKKSEMLQIYIKYF